VFAVRPGIGGTLIFPIVWIACLSSLVVFMRIEGLENVVSGSDIDTYIMNMSIEGPIIPYHWREFIWWLGSRYLYQATGNASIVFIIYDFCLIIATYLSIDLIRKTFFPETNPWTLRYLYFGIFLFFPFPLGMHNTYRSILALTIFLFAFGNAKEKVGKSIFIYAISFFIHNAVILLAPVFVLILNNFKYQKFAFISLLLMLSGLGVISSISDPFVAKSGGEQIGQRIAYIYQAVLLSMFALVYVFESTSESRSSRILLKVMAGLITIYSGCFVILESQTLERVFFMVMVVLFPIFGVYLETRFKPKPLIRLAYLHLAISPLFFLYTTAIPIPF
tara:strand:+ start:14097 stop:15098 length:1002 start_codon:yes stop_codon:yes gene_type:complete